MSDVIWTAASYRNLWLFNCHFNHRGDHHSAKYLRTINLLVPWRRSFIGRVKPKSDCKPRPSGCKHAKEMKRIALLSAPPEVQKAEAEREEEDRKNESRLT